MSICEMVLDQSIVVLHKSIQIGGGGGAVCHMSTMCIMLQYGTYLVAFPRDLCSIGGGEWGICGALYVKCHWCSGLIIDLWLIEEGYGVCLHWYLCTSAICATCRSVLWSRIEIYGQLEEGVCRSNLTTM